MSSNLKLSLLAFAAGLACVAGFAPFGLYPLPVLALALLFHLWLAAESPQAAAKLGFAFGLGLFVAGIGWIYVALHDYGGMPMPVAALATLLFAAFLSLFPALAGYLQARLPTMNLAWFRSPEEEKRAKPQGPFAIPAQVRLLAAMPAAWGALEWVRGWIFTGFPWLTLGYVHTDGPLAGYAPLLGVYGVSVVAALCAGLLALLWRERMTLRGKIALASLVALLAGGLGLRGVAWTQPKGEPVSIALIQGNIAQDLKFNQDRLVDTLETYRRLVEQSDARLIVLPETALPMLREEAPPMLMERFAQHADRLGGTVLVGAFGHEGENYYNSVFALGGGAEQHYHKQHLVPFGEFIPLRPVWGWIVTELLQIPMGDLARGKPDQPPMEAVGQRIAANICYEDVFGEEIVRALPQATLLVNFTNDAWYGDSYAAEQHNQISRMRALETGRTMLRATNTGVTSIIAPDGKVLQQLPQHQEAVLNGMAQGYEGATPYVRWGNAAVVLMFIGMLGYAFLRRTPIPERYS